MLWFQSQPVPDFLEQSLLLVVDELSRKSSGDVSEVGVRRHQDDLERLLDPTSEGWRKTGNTHTDTHTDALLMSILTLKKKVF